MFLSVVCDWGSEDSRKVGNSLLFRYGFKQVQTDVFESPGVSEKQLARLKLDLDRAADFYDALRFYQYPINNTLAITSLAEKRWRRTVIQL